MNAYVDLVLTWMTQFEPFVREFGLVGLFVDIFLESMGLPIPGETLLIIASRLAGLDMYAVAATAFVAAVAGDNAGYVVGRKLGRPLVVRREEGLPKAAPADVATQAAEETRPKSPRSAAGKAQERSKLSGDAD